MAATKYNLFFRLMFCEYEDSTVRFPKGQPTDFLECSQKLFRRRKIPHVLFYFLRNITWKKGIKGLFRLKMKNVIQ